MYSKRPNHGAENPPDSKPRIEEKILGSDEDDSSEDQGQEESQKFQTPHEIAVQTINNSLLSVGLETTSRLERAKRVLKN